MPKAPGTWGSLAAFPLILLLASHRFYYAWGIIFLIIAGFWASKVFLQRHPQMGTDPSFIVVDEVVGQMIAVYGCPQEFKTYLLGFLLFRFFDIVKPWPISVFNRFKGPPWKSAFGIMSDDIVAGIAAHLTLNILCRQCIL